MQNFNLPEELLNFYKEGKIELFRERLKERGQKVWKMENYGLEHELKYERRMNYKIFSHCLRNIKYLDKDLMRQFWTLLSNTEKRGIESDILEVQKHIDFEMFDQIRKKIRIQAIVNIISYCKYCNMIEFKHLGCRETIQKFEKILKLYKEGEE